MAGLQGSPGVEALPDLWAEGTNEGRGGAAPAQKAPQDSCWRPGGAGQLGINSPFPAQAFWRIPTFSRGGPGSRPRQQQAGLGGSPCSQGLHKAQAPAGCEGGWHLGSSFPLLREGKSDFQELSRIQEPFCLERTLSLCRLALAKGSDSAHLASVVCKGSRGQRAYGGGPDPGGETAGESKGSGGTARPRKAPSRGRWLRSQPGPQPGPGP